MAHRTQVILEDWQYDKLLERAEREGRSLGEVVREAVTSYFAPRTAVADPVHAIIGLGGGDDPEAGRNHDAYLYPAPGKEDRPGEDLRRHERVVRARRPKRA